MAAAIKRKVLSMRLGGFTGQEGCQAKENWFGGCAGKTTRHYGEWTAEGHWTGWRGPYCSVKCYKAEHPQA